MGNYLALGVGNNLAPPLGNCLALTASRLGNYLAFDMQAHEREAVFASGLDPQSVKMNRTGSDGGSIP